MDRRSGVFDLFEAPTATLAVVKGGVGEKMQRRKHSCRAWLLSVVAGTLVVGSLACNNGVTNTLVLVASNIAVSTASNNQMGVVGQMLAQPIVVHVTDQNGAAFPNALVAWTVLSGGGSVSATTGVTDVNGNTSVMWTLGPVVGTDSLRASIGSGASVAIRATAIARSSASMPAGR